MQPAERRFVEDAIRLTVDDVLRACRGMTPTPRARWPASPGAAVFAAVPVAVTRRGVQVERVLIDVMREGRAGQITVIGGPGVGSVVEMKAKAARLIGYRWGLSCPVTGRRCRTLYLPRSAACFASRQAHSLTFRALHERPLVRRFRKATRLRHALGEDPPVVTGPLPDRPQAMTERVYWRRCTEIAAVEAVLEVA